MMPDGLENVYCNDDFEIQDPKMLYETNIKKILSFKRFVIPSSPLVTASIS